MTSRRGPLPSLLLGLPGLLALLAACGDDGGASPPDAAAPDAEPELSQRCLDAQEHSDLEWIQENVLTPSCAAFADCHQGRAIAAGDLNLEEGMAEASLVDQPSDIAPEMVLVDPGSPSTSYLMVILGHYGTDDPRLDDEVGTMPYNNPILCEPKRDAIARWIESL